MTIKNRSIRYETILLVNQLDRWIVKLEKIHKKLTQDQLKEAA